MVVVIEPDVALGTTINDVDIFEDGQPDSLEILSDAPHLEHPFATYKNFQLVGNGEQTNGYCGVYIGIMGCIDVPSHKVTTLEGVNYAGKIDRRLVHHHCNKPSCPTCYKKGWAVRQAFKIAERLKEASKRFGAIEHLMISLPDSEYGLIECSLKDMRKKVNGLLKRVGVVGGVVILHAFRYNHQDLWYFSPHFHVVGFIKHGYSRCRNCPTKWNCKASCDGADARFWKLYQDTGYKVKVFGKRKSIVGTLYYQLNHASILLDVERFHVYTYFGVVSYHKLKVDVKEHKRVCRICGKELVWLKYHGDKAIISDVGSPFYEGMSFEDFEEGGIPVYDEAPKRRSVSYDNHVEDYF